MSTDTLARVDVNEAFAATRADQLDRIAGAEAQIAAQTDGFDARVANGGMRNLGNGRYQVIEEGWDKGEIFQVGANGVAMPQHGLDMSTGQAALYSKVPTWHTLGNVVPEGVKDVERVLTLGGIGFDVETTPALYQSGTEVRTDPDHFHTLRTDTGNTLGVVGKIYTPIQNRTAFAFLQELVDQWDVTWESAGAVRDGRRVFVSMRMPTTVRIDPGGINDEIIPFIVALNSHDGTSPFQVVVTPWRPVCANTERFSLRDASARWSVRHTVNSAQRVDEARKTLGLSVKYFEVFAAEEQKLAETEVEMAEFRKLIDSVWGTPEPGDTTRKQNNHAARVSALETMYIGNAETLGRTGYAAERAITQYLDHGQDLRPRGSLKTNMTAARATRLMEGMDDEKKTAAHKQLMTLVRR